MNQWIMTQTWEDILFCHWEAEPDTIQPLLPPKLELDLFQKKAWITILPFRVRHQRFHWMPEIPLLNSYLELNVRTYVKYGGVSGVYFFELDANHLPSVLGAKTLSLPYRLAKMDMLQKNSEIIFNSRQQFGSGEFSAAYRPSLEAAVPVEPNSLSFWLLERYTLFTDFGRLLLRGEIRHEHWEVSSAEAAINKIALPYLDLPSVPSLVHYAKVKQAYILPLKTVGKV